MIHSEGCPGGRMQASYGVQRAPRYRCSHCRRPQSTAGPRIGAYLGPLRTTEAAQTGRYDAQTPNESNRPKSLIQRALDRLRHS